MELRIVGKPQQVVDRIGHLMKVYGKNAKVVDVIKKEQDYQNYLKSDGDPRD